MEEKCNRKIFQTNFHAESIVLKRSRIKWKILQLETILYLKYKKIAFLSIKDVKLMEEAFSPQKRTSSISRHEIFSPFSTLWNIFALLDPDPND